MLKGCQKKIIMVKDTNSRYFESAYFVIKSDLPPCERNSDMLTEAHRIIADYSSEFSAQNAAEKNNTAPSQKSRASAMRFIVSILFALALIGISATAVLAIL